MATNTRARWAKGVEDLAQRHHEVGQYLTVAQVAGRIGLSPNTIADALSRPAISRGRNPLRPLCRPAMRIGNVPLWSEEQVQEALALRRSGTASGHRHLGSTKRQLPVLSKNSANKLGYVSTREIAERVYMTARARRDPESGNLKSVHEQTVRRWARDEEDFPAAIALRARENEHAGVPMVVYDWKQVQAFLHGKRGVGVLEVPAASPPKD